MAIDSAVVDLSLFFISALELSHAFISHYFSTAATMVAKIIMLPLTFFGLFSLGIIEIIFSEAKEVFLF